MARAPRVGAYFHTGEPGVQTPDTRPGRYYVDARNEVGATVLLLGPFARHADALAWVDRCRERACEVDVRAHWYSYGTCRLPDAGDAPPGAFNADISDWF